MVFQSKHNTPTLDLNVRLSLEKYSISNTRNFFAQEIKHRRTHGDKRMNSIFIFEF